MEQKIKNLIKNALKDFSDEDLHFIVEHPESFLNGDYSTNVAMVYAKRLKTNPQDLAKKIMAMIDGSEFEKIEVSDGFINFYLSRKFFDKGWIFYVQRSKTLNRRGMCCIYLIYYHSLCWI